MRVDDVLPPAARRYLEAWNRRDGAAIAACFAEGGTYTDPSSGRIAADELPAVAARLWAAFPDLAFEVVSCALDGDRVAIEWRMRGTHGGPLGGLPPTARPIDVPGVDLMQLEGDAIRSVDGYFDQRAIPAQLGLVEVVQPDRAGPFVFGTAIAASSGNRAAPGAITLTAIEVSSADEVERVRAASHRIVGDLLEQPGFVGWVGLLLGQRMITITAWEQPEDVRAIAASPTHRRSVAEFHRGLGAWTYSGLWTASQVGPFRMRCPSCGEVSLRRDPSASCCGRPLPEPPPYW